MLDLPVRSWVCDRGPVHPDVVIIIEIQELFPSELSASIVDDGVRDSKTENDVLDEIHYLLGANISQGPRLDPLSQLVDHDKQVGQALERFLEGPQEVQAPQGERSCNGDGLELLGRSMDLPHEVLASLAGPHDLSHIIGGRWLVKTLLEGLSDHAS
jgi:hypothetical protein